MNVKMIVTDLDNTLLRRDKTVSDYTVQVFKRARNCGMMIAFATARDFRFVTDHITPLTGMNPDILIADNGALAYCDGKAIYKKMIPNKIVNSLMSQFKLVRCMSTENAYYLSGEYSNDHWSIGKSATIITDFSESIIDDALYIDGNINKSPFILTEYYPEIRAVTYTDVDLITVVHHEATKLKAVFAVKDWLNIQMDDIAVFGDDYSDIEMLSSFNNSIAVANAIDECKAVANYICDTNESDGVAKWLEENVLCKLT